MKVIIFTMLLFVLPASAQAQDLKKGQQELQFDVYAGGIHALQANLDIDKSASDKYNLELGAKTYGLLGKLAPWHGTFETSGWQGSPHKPQQHRSITTWRSEEEIKTYKYNKDGSFAGYSIQDDKNDGSVKEVEKELVEDTSDVLTATLNTMEAVAKNNQCEGETEIFDGKRRYKLIFRQKREVMLEASRWNVYAGPAVECTAEVQPAGGKWHEKPRGWMSIQEQGRDRGTMPTVWFAKMLEGQPAVPVKVRVKTSYGTLFMHLTQYKGGNKSLALTE